MRVQDPDRRNLLEGKVCLVTGGGGSLGRATARLFLKEGARVVLADRNSDALKAAQAALDDVNVSVVAGDATVEVDVARAMQAVVDRHGALDVLVANAGTPASTAPVTEVDVEEFDRLVAVHVRGVMLTCKHGLRVLSDGGSVVIVSGVAGLRAHAGDSARAAVEHAQVGLMRAVAKRRPPGTSGSTRCTRARWPTTSRRVSRTGFRWSRAPTRPRTWTSRSRWAGTRGRGRSRSRCSTSPPRRAASRPAARSWPTAA
jgi:NAD(P)-dependent dehydrogenase (short-subunit alcohol dehydrogenase family)